MKKILKEIPILLLILGSFSLNAQLNLELVSSLDYEFVLNDIWGYTDTETGIEYALVGTTDGVSIVSLEDPSNPTEVQFIPGQNSIWRDIKTWGTFMYVTSDNTFEGLLIADLSTIDQDTAEWRYWSEDIAGRGDLLETHNIYIDEFGLVYLAGSNIGGLVVLDVKLRPWDPEVVRWIATPYSHDIYVRDSLIYSSEIYEGRLAVYDIGDLDNIVRVGTTTTPFEFTHNAWLSDDSRSVFTTDERANAFIGSYDLSDMDNIRELDRWRPAKTVGRGVIPHNVHVWDDYLVISYYTDGCIIVDAAKPDNLIEVGNFDTFLGGDGGFSGSWGAYPFLPSGLVLVSDRQSGLYVLQPNYVRGAYMDVTVLNDVTGEPIFNAEVEILSDEIVTPKASNLEGVVKTGKAIAGEYEIKASHPEYRTALVTGTFENGVQNSVEIRLTPKPRYSVWGEVLKEEDFAPVPFANVVVTDGFFLFETVADAEGRYQLDEVFEGPYRVYAGLFDQYVITELSLGGNLNRSYLTTPGYYDDFMFDYGWTVSGESTGAEWVKDVPILETYRGRECNPSVDLDDDFGDEAFMTGNRGGDAQFNSVEDGFTMLSSPVMDMSDWSAPVISFRPWLCTRFGDLNSYTVLASNGLDTVTLDTIRPEGQFGYWRDAMEVAIEDSVLAITAEMQVHFVAFNEVEANVVKAAVDQFYAFDSDPVTSVSEPIAVGKLQVYPNPGSEWIQISVSDSDVDPDQVVVYDLYGREVQSMPWPSGISTLRIDHDLPSGVYVVALTRDGTVQLAEKYIAH